MNINLDWINVFSSETGLTLCPLAPQEKKQGKIQTAATISDNIIDFCDIDIHQVPSSLS